MNSQIPAESKMTETEVSTANAAATPVEGQPAKNKGAILLNRVALVLSFIGIFVAGVLSLTHALALRIPCGESGGCEIVSSSAASMLFGVPVAYLGFAAYLTLAAITVLRAVFGLANTKLFGLSALAVSGVGALFSAYLQYLAFNDIHAFCPWCFTSAVTMCLMFLVQAYLAQMDLEPEAGRPKDADIGFTVALACLAAIGIGGESFSLIRTAPSLIGERTIIENEMLTPDSMRFGPDSAPVKIVEFSDLLCPSCRAMYPKLHSIVDNANGQVQVIFRHHPLIHNPDHHMSLVAAYVCEYAAEKGKGWQFVDAIYKVDTDQLQTPDQVYKVAASIGLDVNDVKARAKDTDPAYRRVTRDLEVSNARNFEYTPTFVILAPGVNPVATLAPDLENDLNQPQYQKFYKAHAK